MTLTNRLSLFFLGMLALVLLGFSSALYVLARGHLYGQANDRLESTLNTLVAAAEVHSQGVEWEPTQRRLPFGQAPLENNATWFICDPGGRIVDRSSSSASEEWLAAASRISDLKEHAQSPMHWRGETWHVGKRWVRTAPKKATRSTEKHDDFDPAERRFDALAITAGLSLEPVSAILRLLAWALAGLSAGLWCAAFLIGKAVCRRALWPVRSMAARARQMNAADRGDRLPALASGDELEELTKSFNGLLDRLQESFERQRRFTGDASHQLRTPLTALIGQIEVALRRERQPDEYRQVLTALQKQAAHLHRIVETLLFLARADAETRLPESDCIDLGNWMANHLKGWSQHPRARDIHLNQGPSSSLEVEVQPLLLGELVNILIENACKFSDPGSPITLGLESANGTVTLSVADQGAGIAADDLPHVCEPFFRAASASRQGVPGLGLGLAIAKRLAEVFGGRLDVSSTLGQGSSIDVQIPRAGERLRND